MKESSLISYRGKAHKDIYFRGNYHKAMYIGNQLVWEKLDENNTPIKGNNYVTFTSYNENRYIGDGDYDYSGKVSFYVFGDCEIDWGDGFTTRVQTSDDDLQNYLSDRENYLNDAGHYGHSYYYPTNINEKEALSNIGLYEYAGFENSENYSYEDENGNTIYVELRDSLCSDPYILKYYYDEDGNYVELENTYVEKACDDDSFPKTITVTGDIKYIHFPYGTFSIDTPLPSGMSNLTSYSGCYGCVNLDTLPDNLFINLPNLTDLSECFKECVALGELPSNLFADCKNVTNINNMFANTNIRKIPDGLFLPLYNVEQADGIFSCGYSDNGSVGFIGSIGNHLFDNMTKITDFSNTFHGTYTNELSCNLYEGCDWVTSFYGGSIPIASTISGDIFKDCSGCESFANLCSNSTHDGMVFGTTLYSITGHIFAGCTGAKDFEQTFAGLRKLYSIPEDIFADCVSAENFTKVFNNVDQTNLKVSFAGLSNASNFYQAFYSSKIICFDGMFDGCNSIENIESAWEQAEINSVSGSPFKNTSISSLKRIFYSCLNISSVSDEVFKDIENLTDITEAFYYNRSLTRIPTVWEYLDIDTVANKDWMGGIPKKQITNYDDIPDEWKQL